MMYDWYGHGAGWESWLMPMFMIVFVVAVVVAAVFLVRYLAHPQGQATPQGPAGQQPQATQGYAPAPPQQQSAAAPAAETPQDIVRRRYAAGEIDRDEYLQKLGDL